MIARPRFFPLKSLALIALTSLLAACAGGGGGGAGLQPAAPAPDPDDPPAPAATPDIIVVAPDRNLDVPLVRIPVTTTLRVDPTSGALDAVLHGQRIIIRNAADNRIIERIAVDRQNRAVFQAVLGQEIIVEPAARRGTRWYPSSRRLRVDNRTPELVFEWRADAREQGPPVLVVPPGQRQPAQPRAPRFPIPSPQTTPIPRIPLPQAARPPVVIPPAQANPMPRLQPTPVPRLPNRPLPTLPEES